MPQEVVLHAGAGPDAGSFIKSQGLLAAGGSAVRKCPEGSAGLKLPGRQEGRGRVGMKSLPSYTGSRRQAAVHDSGRGRAQRRHATSLHLDL